MTTKCNKHKIIVSVALALLLLHPSYSDAKGTAYSGVKNSTHSDAKGTAFSAPPSSILNSGSRSREKQNFPEPSALKPNIAFWVDVFTRYSSSHAIIHDSVNLGVQYEIINLREALPRKASWRSKKRFMEKRKKYYRNILLRLAKQGGKCRTNEECRVASFFPNHTSAKMFKKASKQTRAQQGMSNRFRDGLIRSGLYMSKMRAVFKAEGVPVELLALPHVESSFNYKAYSKYGAAGIWQFTRSTGKLFLKINYSIDERRDPLKATRAAARLLRKNYEVLGAWPLAITAYNHGRSSMKRAKKRHGTNISAIVFNYKNKRFGFASRNFYVEFLAAKMVAKNPKKYFGNVPYNLPINFDVVKTKSYLSARLLTTHFGYSKKDLIFLNPALRQSIWNGTRRIPKGYDLRLPLGTEARFAKLYNTTPKKQLHARQVVPDYYTIQRGDSISVIARRFHTTTSHLAKWNDLDSRHRIYAGQKLRILNGGKRLARKKATKQKKLDRRVASITTDAASPIPRPTPVKKQKAKPETASKEDKPTAAVLVLNKNIPPAIDYQFISTRDGYAILMVKPEETIGHYSYWSGASIKQIQRLNGWRRKKHIRLGQKIRIPLNHVNAERFENNRYEFHLGLFEDFNATYKITEIDEVVVKRGQSLWAICDKLGTPMWLVRLYNEAGKLEKLHPGQKIRVPLVAAINGESS